MIGWGIIGPGSIASDFAEAMGPVDGGEIVAVASRSRERAGAFADRLGILARYADEADLAHDPDVEWCTSPQAP